MKPATNVTDALPRIEMLGRFCVQQAERTITRFRTRKAAELLAYLAYYRQRRHSREALMEMLWPDEDSSAIRGRLRVELNSLRRQLEPPGMPAGTVLRTDDASVQLDPEAYITDVAEFEAALQAARQEQEDTQQAALLTRAVELYQGELLPGYYAGWIQTEREYLAGVYLKTLRQLTGCLFRLREYDRALAVAQRTVQADLLHEALHRDLMRLYRVLGRPLDALEQYRQLERILQEALGTTPSQATRALAAQLRTSVGEGIKAGPTPRITPPMTLANTSALVDIREREDFGRRGRLPLQFSRFFGREEEIVAIRKRLSSAQERLLTLTGPGGTGKTRLVIELARGMQESFAGGIWFVPLADLFDPRLIVEAIRDTLQLPRTGNVDPLEQVVKVLSAQPALLILDNFEQVAAGGSPVVRTLLIRVEDLRCLVTSRRRLNLAGEHEFPVPPLPVPRSVDSPEQLLHTASVRLFVDRTQAVRPDFQITASNAEDIAWLCVDLEGIPLAIELAAARAKALSPAQIRERLSERFEILATRRMDKGARHRSLWAAIDWSFHLLAPALQQCFARLSVFRGGWILEAAEAVCEEPLSLDYLTQLQGHSLVSAAESAPEMRFRMLESLREYAQEQLNEKQQQALARRHRDYFLRLAEKANPELFGPEQIRWLDRLEQEHDNLRAALVWCLTDTNSIQEGLRLAAMLWPFWDTRGFLAEGSDWLRKMLVLPGAQLANANRALALNVAGNLALSQGDFTVALRLFGESLAIYQALDNRPRIAVLLGNLAIVTARQGDYTASCALHEESLSLRRQVGDKPGIALALNNLGSLARKQGDFQKARALLEESLALRRELGDLSGMALALSNLGNVAWSQADYEAARSFQEESLVLRRQLGDKSGIADALGNLGIIEMDQGHHEEARALQEESLALRQELGDKAGIALALGNLGLIATHQGDYDTAHSWLEKSLALRQELGDIAGVALALANLGELSEAESDDTAARALYEESLQIYRRLEDKATIAMVLSCLGKIHSKLGDPVQSHDCLRESISLAQENGDRKSLVSLLDNFAVLAVSRRQAERAARLYGAADTLRTALGSPRSPADPDWAAFQPLLADSALSTAWKEGQVWTLEQAIAYALEEGESTR